MKTIRLYLFLLATLCVSTRQLPALAQSAWDANPCDGRHADDFTCGLPLTGTPKPMNQVTCWNGVLANSQASCDNITPICATNYVASGGVCVQMPTVLTCPSGYVASGGSCVQMVATVPSGTQCGSAGQYWDGAYFNMAACNGQNLIGTTTTYVWVPPGTFCTGGDSRDCTSYDGYWSPTTSYSFNCPSGYTFTRTARLNLAGNSADSIFSCIKN